MINGRLKIGASFADAMIAGYTAVLCSPEFIYIDEKPGPLDDHALAARLAFFLTNSEPDPELRAIAEKGELRRPEILRAQTNRLLDDPKSRRFVDAFVDYWLDLRKAAANTPDATLYNDYYLDDLLAESAVAETQLFFAELLKRDLPAKNLISSNFAMINERLADHYGLPGVRGVELRKVELPADSVRGGLLTQASVLMITANGTTTSPVLRGAWIMERILGQPSPPPPPVPAVEPDLRGQKTIREQLAKHRDQASCATCHAKIDPPGFALESFDVMGGWRDRYRAIAEKPQREKGIGKDGQPFAFRFGPPVDCTGQMADGRKFSDIREFKRVLLTDESPDRPQPRPPAHRVRHGRAGRLRRPRASRADPRADPIQRPWPQAPDPRDRAERSVPPQITPRIRKGATDHDRTRSRRQFLKGVGVLLSLPTLESLRPALAKAEKLTKPRRMLAICNNLGLLPDYFFPKEAGRGYTLSPYLEKLASHRDDFTVFSGVSHPDVDGGHPADNCFLTAAPHPASGGFRNTISLDQFIAERIGPLTRFPSLTLGVNVLQGAAEPRHGPGQAS